MMKKLIEELQKKEHGFRHILAAGKELLADTELDHLQTAVALMEEESYQARMLGTFLLGQLSVSDKKAFGLLRSMVAEDANWRVQEMLAKAVDHYCQAKGYEQALPAIRQWLSDAHPNMKRAVIEGLRIWTSRAYFKEHPDVAISLISAHRADDSEYLRKAVGNALRDIRKKHANLVDAETATWDTPDPRIAHTKKQIYR